MKLIWETPLWCNTCGGNVAGRVYREESDEPLPEDEKDRALELLKHYHQIYNHTTCWKCGENIKPHEIAGVLYVNSMLKDLCVNCAET